MCPLLVDFGRVFSFTPCRERAVAVAYRRFSSVVGIAHFCKSTLCLTLVDIYDTGMAQLLPLGLAALSSTVPEAPRKKHTLRSKKKKTVPSFILKLVWNALFSSKKSIDCQDVVSFGLYW